MGRLRDRLTVVTAVVIGLGAAMSSSPVQAATIDAARIDAVRSAAAPTFTAFTPNYGPAGTPVKISGSGFTGVTSVLFNGTPAASFTVSSPTSITATVPVAATSGPITVRAASGVTTTQSSFSVSPPSISLSVGDGLPNSPVIVSGRGFRPFEMVEVSFGARAGNRPSANSLGEFRARVVVPVGPRSGAVQVVATGLQSRLTAIATPSFVVHNDWPRMQTGTAPVYTNFFESFLGPGNVGSLVNKWTANTAGGIAAVAGSLVYIAGPGSITALRTSTGAQVWTRTAGFNTSLLIVDGVLYVGGTDGALNGLNPLTGAEVFSTKLSNSPLVSMTIVREVVYAATAGGTLVALSLSTRATRWTYQFGVPVTLSTVTRDAAYAVTQDQHRVIALRLSDRAVLWTHDVEPRANLSGLAYVDPGSGPLVVFTIESPQQDGLQGGVVGLWALDAMTGAFVWLDDRSAEVGGAGWASAPTVDQATGRVFFAAASNEDGNGANEDGNGANSVNAVTAATGRPLWSVTSIGQVAGGLGHWADPVVTNGVVYVGSCGPNHKFLAFDASTGAVLLDYFPSQCAQSIVTNARVYLAGLDGVTALGVPQERPPTQVVNDGVVGTDLGSLFFSAGWARSSNPGEYRQDDHYSKTPDAFVRFPFFGNGFRYWFSMAPHHGIVEVTIDNVVVATIDQYAPVRMDGVSSWISPAMQNEVHLVTIRVAGTKNPVSSGTVATIDRVDYTDG